MNREEKQLLEAFRVLDEGGRRSLIDYAEFLASRAPAQEAPVAEPIAIPRPERESVVKAIRRLSDSYPMLDKGKMLNETSHLMAQHIVHGKDAVDVIDELEIVFRRHYERHTGRE